MIRSANLIGSVSRNAGGLFESVRRLAQSLFTTGMDVRVIGLRDRYTEEDMPAWWPVTVAAFPPWWPTVFGYSPCWLEEMTDYRRDIVHTHGLWLYPSIAAHRNFSRHRRPYLISPHGMLDPWALAHSRWKKVIAGHLYEDRHLRSARCLRALCESEARAIRACGLKNDIAIIPNGIDLPAGPASKSSPWKGLTKDGQKVLLYLGRIHPKKGLASLLRSLGLGQKIEFRRVHRMGLNDRRLGPRRA